MHLTDTCTNDCDSMLLRLLDNTAHAFGAECVGPSGPECLVEEISFSIAGKKKDS